MEKGKYTFPIILTVPFIWALSNSMIIPILPRIQTSIGISRVEASLLITVLSIPTGLLLPVSGFLSDRLSRLAVMIPGILTYGVGGLVAGCAGFLQVAPYPVLLAGRVLQGIGATGTTLIAMSLTGDLFENEERVNALGLIEGANSTGKLLAPLIGSAAALLGWFAPFFVYPFVSFPAALALWLWAYEPAREREHESLTTYFQVLTQAFVIKKWSLVLSLFSGFTAIFLWFGNLFFLAQALDERFGIGEIQRGFVLAVPVFTLAFTSVFSSRYLKGTGLTKLVATGLGIVALVMMLVPQASSPWLLSGITAVIGVALGITLPPLNTLITSAMEKERRGIITTAYGSVRCFGSALGPPVFGAVMSLGDPVLFFGAGILSLAAAVVSYLWIEENQMLPPGMHRTR